MRDGSLVLSYALLSAGLRDIELSRAGTVSANWAHDEITVTIIGPKYESSYLDDVREALYKFCTDER